MTTPFGTFPGQGQFGAQPSDDGAQRPLRGNIPPNMSGGSVFTPGKRRRFNLPAICANIFVPWFVFCGVYAAMTFSLHYQRPALAWLVVVLGLLLAVGAAVAAIQCKNRGLDEVWYTFSAIAILLATVAAAVFGDMNFWFNMHPFYDIENLNTYPSVNPAREKGQQLMDAGRVYFSDGTSLDMRKAMAFKNLDVFCVAPIVHGDEQLPSYDYWAVGVNCCSGVSSDFRCGEFNNPHARAGLRLMRDEQRPFFRLAVQQAEAAYNIKATHPLFFYWMQDPVAEMNAYKDEGYKYYLLGIFTHFAFNLFCAIVAVVAFSKLGHY